MVHQRNRRINSSQGFFISLVSLMHHDPSETGLTSDLFSKETQECVFVSSICICKFADTMESRRNFNHFFSGRNGGKTSLVKLVGFLLISGGINSTFYSNQF